MIGTRLLGANLKCETQAEQDYVLVLLISPRLAKAAYWLQLSTEQRTTLSIDIECLVTPGGSFSLKRSSKPEYTIAKDSASGYCVPSLLVLLAFLALVLLTPNILEAFAAFVFYCCFEWPLSATLLFLWLSCYEWYITTSWPSSSAEKLLPRC